ncbi:TPA: phage virion morphogenesis protein [Photobacterium damselae]
MTISVQVTGTEQLRRYQQLLDRLSNPNHKPQLLDALGAVVESQTRRRIADEKESPDGQAWPDWSQAYAKTRHGNNSLLQGEGGLLDSIEYQVERNQVRIGSPLAYARVHQEGFSGSVQVKAHWRTITMAFGKAIAPRSQKISAFTRAMEMPQREFLGLSDDNQTEVYAVIGDFWQELMR